MTEDILKTYLKVLYFINNRLRHKFINSIKATDYQKHRINMDLDILKRNIEREAASLALITGIKLPIVRTTRKKDSVLPFIEKVNKLVGNTNLLPKFRSPCNYNDHYSLLKYRTIRQHCITELKHLKLTSLYSYLPIK